ncbi:MAG: lipoyl(octanoyl) transferase LipB [Ignavibacteriae bacterium]|nr:lipoyl(octanoyl) transferase LipB [Ignavibacteriota bacterium]
MENQHTKRKLLVCDLGKIKYQQAWDIQKKYFNQRTLGNVNDILFFCEHTHTYTLGKVADKSNLLFDQNKLDENGIEVFEIDRGGDITYHGPGQIVGYAVLNLSDWKKDTHLYLRSLEEVIIDTCADYGITSKRIDKYTGVWIDNRKICAIGVKVSRWITMHGFAFNVNTDLKMFDGIIPCGITDKEVTSLSKELSREINFYDAKMNIVNNFKEVFSYSTVEEKSFSELEISIKN